MSKGLGVLFFIITFVYCAYISAMGAETPIINVKLRCAAWSAKPQDRLEMYFIRQGNKYVDFRIEEMRFGTMYFYKGENPISICRKATPAELERRKKNKNIKYTDKGFIPILNINVPPGMKDIGVLFRSNQLKESRPAAIIDMSDEKFPMGTSRLFNLSNYDLLFQFGPERFSFPKRGNFQTKILSKDKEVIAIKIAYQIKEHWELVHSTAGVFKMDTKNLIFVLDEKTKNQYEDEEGEIYLIPKFVFCMIQEYKRTEEPPAPEVKGKKETTKPQLQITPPQLKKKTTLPKKKDTPSKTVPKTNTKSQSNKKVIKKNTIKKK